MATIKQYIKSNLTVAFMFVSIVCIAQTKTDSLKHYFSSAKAEIEAMLSNKIPLDYERAVFITENAFYENAMDYTLFKENIDFHLQNIQFISTKSAEVNTITTTHKITVSKDSANKNIQRAFDNFAIYKYITDTTFFVIDSTTYYHPKFQYQFSDPFATKNWQTSQVTNLLNDETNTGNCNALTTLFKLFSLRLNSNAKLCTAPNHIFIRHANENGIFFNIELASQSFPGTGSIETISYTTDQAARSGIAMRELNLKQSINLLLINLAKGYERKFNNKSDKFILDCADLSLKYDNLNLNAMLLKAEYLNDKIVSSKKSITQLQTNTDFIALQSQIATLYNLGYREMPTEMKNRLMSALMQDTTYMALSQNKTYNPFTNAYKTYNRSFSLSNGLFEEVNTTKPKEVFFNIVFDTKTKKITELKQIDNLYNNYEFDAVVFALSLDPLAAKGPQYSPYSAFANNPITHIDDDGQWPTPVHHEMLKTAFGDDVKQKKMTATQLRQLIKGSDNADNPFKKTNGKGNQSDQNQFMHGMKPKGMSDEMAISKANDWVNGKVDEFVKTGDFEKLGEALHTIMDITSPAHRDKDGKPLVYDGILSDHSAKENPNKIEKNNGKNGYITVDEMKARKSSAQIAIKAKYAEAVQKREEYLKEQSKASNDTKGK